MNNLIVTTRTEAKQLATKEDLRTLARFVDPKAQAVSFYFRLGSATDNSHRREIVLMKDMVRNIAAGFPRGPQEAGIVHDLDALLAVTDELREAPSYLVAIFACFEQQTWHEFRLPALSDVTRLEAGRHFDLAPLVAAVESCGPYAVVLIERGRARGFEVRGTAIEEVKDFFTIRDTSAHEENARTGWSHHVDSNQLEKSRAWARDLSQEIQRFQAARHGSRLIIGCREDLWGEFAPLLALEIRLGVAGRFHLPNFDVTPAEVLRLATPLFEAELRKRREELAHDIKENPGRRVVGLEQVAARLQEGRIQKLLLDVVPEQKLAECEACGNLQMELAGKTCRSCSSTSLHSTPAAEALVRKALLTDVEILVNAAGVTAGFDGVAGLLRY